MACQYTQGFPLPCGRDNGGVQTVWLAPFGAKGNLIVVSGSLANTGSFLVSGSTQQFYAISLEKETAEAQEDYTVDPQNNSGY
jgi:hypothetical protein